MIVVDVYSLKTRHESIVIQNQEMRIKRLEKLSYTFFDVYFFRGSEATLLSLCCLKVYMTRKFLLVYSKELSK